MNSRQMAKYVGHWHKIDRTHDTHRRAQCNHCSFQCSEPRHGPRGNALGAAQRLFGKIATHLREVHADKLETSS